MTDFIVVCPPGKSTLAHLGCALAGVSADVLESPLAVEAFYVFRNEPPAPLKVEFSMTFASVGPPLPTIWPALKVSTYLSGSSI